MVCVATEQTTYKSPKSYSMWIIYLSFAGSLAPSRTSLLSGNDEIGGASNLQAAYKRNQVTLKRLSGLGSAASAAVVPKTSSGCAAPAPIVSRQIADSVAAQAVHVAGLKA